MMGFCGVGALAMAASGSHFVGDVLLSSGGSDGLVKMWDLRQMKSAIGALEDAGDDEYVRGSFHDAGLGGRFGGEGGTRAGGKRPRGISGIAIDPTSSRVVVSYVVLF